MRNYTDTEYAGNRVHLHFGKSNLSALETINHQSKLQNISKAKYITTLVEFALSPNTKRNPIQL